MTDPLKVSMESFVYELRMDLPRLYAEHPTGITYHVLREEYGEPIPRIIRATQLLSDKGHIRIEQNASREHYILPVNAPHPREHIRYADLTDLQRRLFIVLSEARNPENNLVRTNYTQLARILNCSQGGVRSSLDRLTTLKYLHTHAAAIPGKQASLVLAIHPDKIQPPFDQKEPT